MRWLEMLIVLASHMRGEHEYLAVWCCSWRGSSVVSVDVEGQGSLEVVLEVGLEFSFERI